jgi:DNA polymerase I-like protein with 3'-5' exonuclease and polymerase domains
MIYFISNKRQLIHEKTTVELSTVNECLEYLNTKKIIGLDIETTRKYPKNKYREDIYKPGLDPFVSKICMLQIGDLENQFIIDVRDTDIQFLKPILESESVLKVGHNLKFETKHLLHNHGIFIQNVWDTMICERVLYNGEKLGYSLEALMKRHLGYETLEDKNLFDVITEEEEEDDYFDVFELIDGVTKEKLYVDKSIRTQFIEIGDTSFTIKQIEYGATDIVTPLQLYNIQKKGRSVDGELYLPSIGFTLENKFVPILGRIELRGITVDIPGWLEMYDQNIKIYTEKKQRLDEWVASYHPKFSRTDLFSDRECLIQWTSPKEVVNFAKYLGICPKEKSKFTGKEEYTVGAKAMFKLLTNENKENFYAGKELEFQSGQDTQAFILNFLLLKKYQQLTTTFGKEWLRYVHPITGKVYSNFIQLMNTGRMSSTSINLQQIPNGKEWRKLFISAEGNDLIATDFSAQEVRIAAEVTEVEAMRELFTTGHPIFGTDVHSLTATNMFKIIKNDPSFICDKEKNKKERSVAKAMIFKIIFGGSDFTIAMDLGVPIEEGTKFYNAFFQGYPGLKENFENTKKLALKRGWIELDSYTKKRYFYPYFGKMKELYEKAWSYYPDDYRSMSADEKTEFKKRLKIDHPELSLIWKDYMVLKGKLERAALNYRIQGTASSMTKLAVILMEKEVSLEEGVSIIVHDEVVQEFESKLCEDKSRDTVECMRKSGVYFCPNVPMDAETAIGKHWIH